MTEPSPSYVILGATGGIGAALPRRLAASGARLVIAGRDHNRLAALEKETGAVSQSFDRGPSA
jgi:NADP-dependent 3-hydroxy acid dehydrogenase YdfG